MKKLRSGQADLTVICKERETRKGVRMKSDMMKAFETEIEEARQTGKSDFEYVFWDYCTEDASPEVLALCEAARRAHKAALLEWECKHPAEHAAEVARAKEEYSAWEAAEIDRAD